jgi:predicted NBD/HSP70 family sugar kinase/biotin operon repressor
MGALEELRERNRLRIIDALRRKGTASRAEITEAVGLSRTTVTAVVSDLLASGIVVERPLPRDAERGRGRPAALLALDASAGAAIGIDFGHRQLHVAIADLSSTVLIERRVAFDPHASLDHVAELAHSLLAEVEIPMERVVGAGLSLSSALPGSLNPAPELASRLGIRVTVDNDANLGALAEARIGAGRGREAVIYVKVASGIGAGIVLHGRVHHGATGDAGEIGHVPVRADGDLCRCGNRGCLETVASTTALLAALRWTYGDSLTVASMLEVAQAGDVGVQRVITDAGRAIGRTLADLCNSLNPDAIVVGGEVSGGGWLLHGIRESIDRYAQPPTARAVQVVASALGPRSSVLGALLLAALSDESLFINRLT